MKRVFLGILLLSPLSIFSLEHPKQSHQTYLFSDHVNVRQKPGTDSPVLTNLMAGTRIEILARSSIISTNQGYVDYWYKIRINNLTGYIWGGLISNNSLYIKKYNSFFLVRNFSEDSYSQHKNLNVFRNITQGKDIPELEFKLIKKNTLLAQTNELCFSHCEFTRLEFKTLHGFSSQLDMVLAETVNDTYLFIINDTNFTKVLYASRPGGEEWAGEYRIVFPDMPQGKYNTILVIYKEWIQTIPGQKTNETTYQVEYTWDPQKNVFLLKKGK